MSECPHPAQALCHCYSNSDDGNNSDDKNNDDKNNSNNNNDNDNNIKNIYKSIVKTLSSS